MNKQALIEKLLLEGKSVSEIALEVGITTAYVNLVKRNAGINNGTELLIQHHKKYEEIHGMDEIVWMTNSEHRSLHMRLRKEGKCTIPVDKLRTIASAAHNRTEKGKKCIKEYIRSESSKQHHREYEIQNIQTLDFIETPGINTRFYEHIRYNRANGMVTYSASFMGTHRHILPVIDI